MVAKQKRRPADRGLSNEDWIELARESLITEGLPGVKVDRLAKKAGVTRGGFYYRFQSHQALLDALLKHWQDTNNQPIIDVLTGPGTPAERFQALVNLWVEERDFDPHYDTAIRAWSRVSRKVANAVHRIDDIRIDMLRRLFREAGYPEDEAFIRARITYFHQVGYYAMGVRESTKRRKELSDLYYRILTGFRSEEFKHPRTRSGRPAARNGGGRSAAGAHAAPHQA